MGLFSGIARWFAPPVSDAGLAAASVRAVDAVDPSLKAVAGWERRLGPAVAVALAHCEALAADIPGPLDIDVAAFASDPLVHAIFAAPEDIAAMLGRSRAVRAWFDAGTDVGTDEFFGLLGMRRREKAVSGIAVRGEVVQHGVAQRLLYFTDHTLDRLAPGHAAMRDLLRDAAFDGIAGGFAAELARRRAQRDDTRIAASLERTPGGAAARALATAIAELTPEAVLAAFAEWLAAAPRHLYLKPSETSVDLMGVIRDAPDPEATTLALPELVGRDRRHWLVVVVRVRREDAAEALRRREEANRYLLI